MAYIPNERYNDLYVTAICRFFTKDPWGNDFLIYSQQQFKWTGKFVAGEEDPCSTCKQNEDTYVINARAHCEEGVFLFGGEGISVPFSKFVLTTTLILPPVMEQWENEIVGKDINFHIPPHLGPPEENRHWDYNADLDGPIPCVDGEEK